MKLRRLIGRYTGFLFEKYLSNILLYITDLRDMTLTEANFLDLLSAYAEMGFYWKFQYQWYRADNYAL